MTRPPSPKSPTERESNTVRRAPTDVGTRGRPPDGREGADTEPSVVEWVRRSTAAQGLPEFVDDPVIGDAIARILLDD